MFEKITSVQNPKVKHILQLGKSSERKSQGLFIAEGLREIQLSYGAGYRFSYLFYCPEVGQSEEVSNLVYLLKSETNIYEVSKPVFEKVAYRENSDGLLAVGISVYLKLEDLKLKPAPLIIVLEKVEKPGNLGAILRTADAARVDAILVCDPLTDIYNPNVIRSSIGCVFTSKVVCCSSQEALDWLNNSAIRTYAAALTAKHWYHETSFKEASAIVMGTEADGLSDFWLNKATDQIKIPMLGKIDSLNVSNATAILVFEAMRQRNFKV